MPTRRFEPIGLALLVDQAAVSKHDAADYKKARDLFLRLFRLCSLLSVGVSVSILQPLLLPVGVGPVVAPAIMIMHPVNWGVGVPGLGEIGGLPGSRGTDAPTVSMGRAGRAPKKKRPPPPGAAKYSMHVPN